MKKSVEVESRRIGGTGLVVGLGEGQGVGQGEGAGAPCPVQAHSCACPTQEASPSTTAPQSAALRGSGRSPVSLPSEVAHAAAPQFAALRGSGRSPVSLASKGGVA